MHFGCEPKIQGACVRHVIVPAVGQDEQIGRPRRLGELCGNRRWALRWMRIAVAGELDLR